MYNSVKDTARQPALLATILGFINPTVALPIAAVGIIAFAVIKIFKNDKKEPLPSGSPTVKSTVPAIANEPLNNDLVKKEMIRLTMSELGKKSVAARARKKAELLTAES